MMKQEDWKTIKECPECHIFYGAIVEVCIRCGGKLEIVKGPVIRK